MSLITKNQKRKYILLLLSSDGMFSVKAALFSVLGEVTVKKPSFNEAIFFP